VTGFHPEAWHWIVIGLALVAVEMVMPTDVLLWFGIAGVVTGLAVAVAEIGAAWQLVVFATLAFVSYFPVRWAARQLRASDETDDDTLNRRGRSAIGHHVTVIEAIQNGYGAVRVGDSRWRATCEQDVPEGAKVEVTGVDGTTLTVKRLPGAAGEEPC
jgi:membrane protein implicated in regulation of membrane protease activity